MKWELYLHLKSRSSAVVLDVNFTVVWDGRCPVLSVGNCTIIGDGRLYCCVR